jgi:hypothetical protein
METKAEKMMLKMVQESSLICREKRSQVAVDILKKYGVTDDTIFKYAQSEIEKKKGKGSFEELFKELLPNHEEAYQEFFEKAKYTTYEEIYDKYGQPDSEEYLFNLYGITQEDRLKGYQLLVEHGDYQFLSESNSKDEKDKFAKEAYLKYIKNVVVASKVFEVPEEVNQTLLLTKAEETNLPFEAICLDCRLEIEDRTYYGICVFNNHSEDKNGAPIVLRTIFGVYSSFSKKDGEIQAHLHYDNIKGMEMHEKKFSKIIKNYVDCFLHFINEPEVKVFEKPSNPKNNKRREERGKRPLPSSSYIRIEDNLRKYIEQVNSYGSSGLTYTHKFWVRGHFFRLRNKQRYKKLYALDLENLNRYGFQLKEGMIIKWRKPFIKGKGLLINKPYQLHHIEEIKNGTK